MGLRIQTLRAPARTLSQAQAEQLRRRILDLNLRLSDAPAFRDNWAARIDRFLDTTDVLELAWDGDELVGHLGEQRLVLSGLPAVYIDSFTITPERQTGGLGRTLAGRSVLRTVVYGRGRTVLHVSRTCNAHVAAGVWNGLRDGRYYHPSYDPARPTAPELVAAATELCAELWPDKRFVAETGVLEGAYAGPFIEVSSTRHRDVARYFETHVDAARGDAVVQIVRYTPATWLRLASYFVRHRLRRRSRSRAQTRARA